MSDDSDIEVHPNVDKKSFIRAKQTQIHQERINRRHQIETLKYEKIINEGLLSRIDGLLKSLKDHKERAEKGSDSAESIVFQALMESTGNPEDDNPPPAPAGIHTGLEQPSYSKMMAALVDQCKNAIDKANPTDRYPAFVTEITSHQTKVENLQKELFKKLAELEKEEKTKITSESIHTGFDSSFVSKSTPSSSTAQATKTSSGSELLNPARPTLKSSDTGQSSGADADIEEGSIVTRAPINVDSDDEDMQASPVAKKFAKIRFGDYRSSLDFISNNLEVLSEKNTDGLLVEAFNGQTEHRDDYARQCVHQALLLQYCRSLGKDGVGLFFKRITTPGHQAQKLFMDDVNSTYARIRARCRELEEQGKRDEAGVEQIQLHAVDPNTKINISVPPAGSEDEGTQQARQIFETFPPGLQRALESGSLDRVNEVLGKMSVEDAEEVVEKLGGCGMLSMEEGVIDATTDEGRRQMEEIERTGRMPGQEEDEGQGRIIEEVEDPGMD